MGPLYNVKTVRIIDQKVLDVPMTLIKQDVKIKGKVISSKKATCFIINHTAENPLFKFRYELKDIKMLAAETSFTAGNKKFKAGTFIIPVQDNPPETADL